MVPYLVWIPAGVSAILGAVYLYWGNARPVYKMLGVALFAVAMYLQFFSRFVLAGFLLQVALALFLALWMHMMTTSIRS